MRPLSRLSRRSALGVGLIALAGSLLAATAAPATAASTADTVQLVATTVHNTLPAAPTIGTNFAMLLALFDTNAASVGDGSITGTVVDVTKDTPPKILVQSQIVLRLNNKGELHLSTMHVRVVPSPVENPVVIVGGTDSYANAHGDGTISYPDLDRVNITLKVTTS